MRHEDPLQFDEVQGLQEGAIAGGTMLLALSGWMDGGDVSTGTVFNLLHQLDAVEVARIDPEPFYIYNIPGSMEVSALFRPAIRIKKGQVRSCAMPSNTFYLCAARKLAFFIGKEPNLAWRSFGQCIFRVARFLGVKRILFVGSFGGAVPHTRQPRLFAAVSDPALLLPLKKFGIQPSTYQGPGSFSSYLMTQAAPQGLEMTSLVAEIPAYLQGTNPLSIEAVTRLLGSILSLPMDLAAMRSASDEWESRVSEAVAKDKQLAQRIRELESAYDEELLKTQGTPEVGEAE